MSPWRWPAHRPANNAQDLSMRLLTQPSSGAEQAGGLAGLEPATTRLRFDNPRPAARESGRGSGEESALPTELQPPCLTARPGAPATYDALGSRVFLQHRTPPGTKSTGAHASSVKQPSRALNEKRPTCLLSQVGRREIPWGRVLSARSPPVLRVFVSSLAGNPVERRQSEIVYGSSSSIANMTMARGQARARRRYLAAPRDPLCRLAWSCLVPSLPSCLFECCYHARVRAKKNRATDSSPPGASGLTASGRDSQVLTLMARGKSVKLLAECRGGRRAPSSVGCAVAHAR